MRKHEEISNPNSCFNKASDQELLFVLLERDKAAPATIRFWAEERIRRGLNSINDEQITRALQISSTIEYSQRSLFDLPRLPCPITPPSSVTITHEKYDANASEKFEIESFRNRKVKGVLGGHDGDWGWLPDLPCRFCFYRGAMFFLIDDGPEGKVGLSPVRCDNCGRSWVVGEAQS